jgi:hypothetical protein
MPCSSQRVEADLVEFQRPQQADAVTVERGDPGLQTTWAI